VKVKGDDGSQRHIYIYFIRTEEEEENKKEKKKRQQMQK